MAVVSAFFGRRPVCGLLETGLLVWLCLASVGPLAALDPTKTIGQYSLSSWQSDSGLPQSSVYAIAQTPDGYLWLGTGAGLVRFDGVRFTLWNRANTPELVNHHVLDLAVDRDGSLWIATNGGGVVQLRDGRFRNFGTAQGLRNLRVFDLEPSARGGVWAGTYGGGVSLLRDGEVSTWTTAEGLASDSVFAIREAADGSVWLGTHGGGLDHFQEGIFHHLTDDDGLGRGGIWALLEDRHGDLWVGTTGGLSRLSGGTIKTLGSRDGLAVDTVTELAEDRDGNLWIGTNGGGISRLTPEGRLSTFRGSDGLASEVIGAIFEDTAGNLWIGTVGGGLARLRDGDFTTLGREQGLRAEHVTSVFEDAHGALWIGTYDGGVERIQDGRSTHFGTREGLPSELISTVFGDRRGDLWVGTPVSGLARYRDGRFSTFTTADGLADNAVFALAEDREGDLWIGTNGGLNRFRNGIFERWTEADGLPSNQVRTLHEDAGGRLWIGTNGGLARLEDGRFTAYTTADGLPSNNLWSIWEEPAGTLWLGTSGGGLARLRAGTIAAVTAAQGLPDDNVLNVLGDGLGNLWLATSQGIARLSLAELEAVADGRQPNLTAVTYGLADGLKTTECQGGSRPSAWRGADGRLWFPTFRGLAVVDPSRLRAPPAELPVLVESITADGAVLDASTRLEIEPGLRRLEIAYTALSFRAPSRLRFRYRLEGLDRDWIDAGSRRTAFYTHLPHGRYTFRVTAREPDGEWSREAATLSFELRPQLWETTLFRLLVVVMALPVPFLFYRLRIARLERRERILAQRIEEALARVKVLSGMLPICASCKNVRDDQGYWSQIETYLALNSEAELSHSLCPDCAQRLYPEQVRLLAEMDAETSDADLARIG